MLVPNLIVINYPKPTSGANALTWRIIKASTYQSGSPSNRYGSTLPNVQPLIAFSTKRAQSLKCNLLGLTGTPKYLMGGKSWLTLKQCKHALDGPFVVEYYFILQDIVDRLFYF
jgi:hypothetical protein